MKASSGMMTDFFLLITSSTKTTALSTSNTGKANPKYASGQKTAGLTNVDRNESTSAMATMLPEYTTTNLRNVLTPFGVTHFEQLFALLLCKRGVTRFVDLV